MSIYFAPAGHKFPRADVLDTLRERCGKPAWVSLRGELLQPAADRLPENPAIAWSSEHWVFGDTPLHLAHALANAVERLAGLHRHFSSFAIRTTKRILFGCRHSAVARRPIRLWVREFEQPNPVLFRRRLPAWHYWLTTHGLSPATIIHRTARTIIIVARAYPVCAGAHT